MLKKILLAALWLPLMALAQSYPSPTFNNVTVNGTLTNAHAAITGGSISGISPPIPIASGGTNATTASAALANLGGMPTTGGTFTGNVGISAATSLLTINDSAAATSANLLYSKGGTVAWNVRNNSSGNNFGVDRYVSGTLTDTPFSISNSTGQATFSTRPTFNGATPWDSANLNFASPPAIGGTTPNTGAFTTFTSTTTPETVNISPHQNIVMFQGQTTDYSDNTITQSNTVGHTTTSNSAFSIASTVTGGGTNGPIAADYGQYLSVIKNNYLTSPVLSELDGLSIVTRNGQGDTDGILVNAGGVAGYMGILEGTTNQIQATTGTVLNSMDIQLGPLETGLTGAAFSGGFVATAQTGTIGTGLLIQSQAGASWNTAIQVNANSAGAATFSVTPAGLVTAKGGIAGSVVAPLANTVGENKNNTTNNTGMTSSAAMNCTSLSLPPGNWLVWGVSSFSPAGTTTVQAIYTGIGTTSATLPSSIAGLVASFTTGQGQQLSAPMAFENLTTTTTVYLVAESVFGVSTMTCSGSIYAMRYN